MSKKNTLFIFVLCFVVPFVGAIVLLQSGWLPSGKTNHGRLMPAPVTMENWQHYPVSPWTIALAQSPQCINCEQQQQAMQSLFVALGKHQDKVRLAVVANTPTQEGSATLVISPKPQALKPGNVYLIDRHGLVVLEYEYALDEQANRLIHKGILKDVKKLLNYSRSS